MYNALTQIDHHISTAFSSQYHNISMNIQIHNNNNNLNEYNEL